MVTRRLQFGIGPLIPETLEKSIRISIHKQFQGAFARLLGIGSQLVGCERDQILRNNHIIGLGLFTLPFDIDGLPGRSVYIVSRKCETVLPISVQQSVNVEGTGIAAALLRDCRLRAEIVIRNLGIEEVAVLDRIPCQSDRSRKCLGADSLYGERRHGRLIVPAARNAARTGKEQQYFIYAFHRCSFSNS